MSPALPLRVQLHFREPAQSLSHRLGTRWSMSRTEFERFVGFRSDEVGRGEHLDTLAELAGVDPAALRMVTPIRVSGSRAVRVGKAWTDVADLTGGSLRICTACVASDRETARLASLSTRVAAWARPEWFVRSVATCVIHQRLLVESCQACGISLSVDNPAIDTCRCGYLQSQLAAPRFDSQVDAALVALIRSDGAGLDFRQAGLHHISSHLVRLGSLTLGRSEYPPPLSAIERLEMRETGLAVVVAGEIGLSKLLDDVVRDAPPGRSGDPGLVSSYGWAWRSWLGLPTSNPMDQALREEFRRHAECNGIRNPVIPGGVTLKVARGILGSGHDRARRIVVGAELLSGAELRWTRMSIDGARVAAIATEMSNALDCSTAAKRLGIGRKQFRSLVAAGFVQPHELSERLDDRSRFIAESLDDFIDGMCAGLPTLAQTPCGCVSLPNACRNASIPLAAALRAIADRALTPVGRTNGHRLDAIWVTVRDLRALKPVTTDTAAYAARQLSIHYEAALWLASKGMLGDGPGVVDPRHVERFSTAFCTSAQVGRMLSVTAKAAAAACRNAGLRPAFGPPECRQAIWSRDAVCAALGARLVHAR